MQKHIIFFSLLLFSYCKKQKIDDVKGGEIQKAPQTEIVVPRSQQVDKAVIRDPTNLPQTPLGFYNRGGEYGFTPDGKLLRAYNTEIFETRWGPVYDAPILYLYDREDRILAIYNVFELIFEKSWGGVIRIIYNNERNSFDMIFSLDAYGNYGTAYIDLNTNEFVCD